MSASPFEPPPESSPTSQALPESPSRGPEVTWKLAGEVDVARLPELYEAMEVLPEACDLTVDLSRVTFMDASGLRALVWLRRTVEAKRGTLSVFGASPFVSRLLSLAGLNGLLLPGKSA